MGLYSLAQTKYPLKLALAITIDIPTLHVSSCLSPEQTILVFTVFVTLSLQYFPHLIWPLEIHYVLKCFLQDKVGLLSTQL